MVRSTCQRINGVVGDGLDMGALAHSMSEDYDVKQGDNDRIINKGNVLAIGLYLAVCKGAQAREELIRSPDSLFGS